MKAMNEKQMKQVFFERLFEERVVRYEHEVDGKYVDFVLTCTNESLRKFIEKQIYKYRGKYSREVILSESMYWSHVAIQRFTIKDGGSWEGILDGTDKANIGRLITNIKTTIENEMIRFVNDDVKFTTERNEDGKVQSAKYKFNVTSLDSIIDDADGEQTILMNMISNDMNYFNVKEQDSFSEFNNWFWENYTRVLTKTQVELIDSLKRAKHEKANGYYSNDLKDFVKFNPRKITYYLDRIANRTLKAWEKENPLGEKTQLQLLKEQEINLWTELIDLVYQEEVEGMNDNISDWIIANLDNEKVMNMVYDNFKGAEIEAVVKAYNTGVKLPSKVIYKFVGLVEERLDKLAVMETASVKFYKKPEEMGRWTKEAHKQYNKKLKEWKEQPCKVYKLNEDGTVGEFLREEAYKPFKERKNTINEVTPTGAIVSKEIVE